MTNEVKEAISAFKEWIERDEKIEYADRLENIEIYKLAIKALEQGDALDKIKAEIEKLNSVDYGSMYSYESHNGARDMKRDVLEIIDEYRKGGVE